VEILTDRTPRPTTLVDGKLTEQIDCLNRGTAYGDGLFETIALVTSAPRLWPRHFARLRAGAARLFIECPAEQIWLTDLAAALTQRGPSAWLVLKLMLIRGAGSRGYAPDLAAPPVRG
jgi:4-amino-4-deoxychorismate lyase